MLKPIVTVIALLFTAPIICHTTGTADAAPQSGMDHLLLAKKPKKIKFQWEQNMADALRRAQQEHKLVFVDIGAPWCGSCRSLEKNIFPDGKVQEFLNTSYVSAHLEADSPEGKQMLQRYGMRGIPALFVFDETGILHGKMAGAPPNADTFIRAITQLTNEQR